MRPIIEMTKLMIAISVMATSCGEREDVKPKEEGPAGGKGGNAILKVTAQHHNDNIDSCTVYITYNATNKGNFDDSAKCVPSGGKPVATFSGLKKGNYYLYGEGWDQGIGEAVEGGISFTVTEEKSYELFIAVTEHH